MRYVNRNSSPSKKVTKKTGVSYSNFAFSNIPDIDNEDPQAAQNTMQYLDSNRQRVVFIKQDPRLFEHLHNPRKQISSGNSFRHLSKHPRAPTKRWTSSTLPPMKNLSTLDSPRNARENNYSYMIHLNDTDNETTMNPMLDILSEEAVLCRIFCYFEQQFLIKNIGLVCHQFWSIINDPQKILSQVPVTFRFGKYPDPLIVQAISTRLFLCPWQDVKLQYRHLPQEFLSWVPSIANRIISLEEIGTYDDEKTFSAQNDILTILGPEKLSLLSRVSRICMHRVERQLLQHATGLKWLHVKCMESIPGISEILDGIGRDPHLKYLYGLGIVTVKTEMQLMRLTTNFIMLRHLEVYIHPTFSASLMELSSLEHLVHLYINYQETMHTELLSVLRKLNVTSLAIDFEKNTSTPGLAELFGALPIHLKELELIDNFDAGIALPSLSRVKETLKRLVVTRCLFKSVHHSNAELKNLEDLSWTSQSSVNVDTLIKRGSVEKLHVRCTTISLGLDTYRLSCLTHLDLSNCDLRYLPNSISSCKSLKELNLKDNPQFRFSPNIGLLVTLEIIRIGSSFGMEKAVMNEVPSNISKIHNLRILEITGTHLQEVPTKLWKHSRLEYLDLSNNSILELPEELFSHTSEIFPRLEYLLIQRNVISRRPQILEICPSLKFALFDDKGFAMPPSHKLPIERSFAHTVISEYLLLVTSSLKTISKMQIFVDHVLTMRNYLQILYYLKITSTDGVERIMNGNIVVCKDTNKPVTPLVRKWGEKDYKLDKTETETPFELELEIIQDLVLGEKIGYKIDSNDERWEPLNYAKEADTPKEKL